MAKRQGLSPILINSEFRQIFRFALVGLLNTAVDYLLFILLINLTTLNNIVAHSLSYSAGLVNSFFWNKLWTFKQPAAFKLNEVIKFIIVNITALAVSGLVLFIVRSFLAFPDELAKLLALPFSLAINYLGNKKWVFRVKPQSSGQYTQV